VIYGNESQKQFHRQPYQSRPAMDTPGGDDRYQRLTRESVSSSRLRLIFDSDHFARSVRYRDAV